MFPVRLLRVHAGGAGKICGGVDCGGIRSFAWRTMVCVMGAYYTCVCYSHLVLVVGTVRNRVIYGGLMVLAGWSMWFICGTCNTRVCSLQMQSAVGMVCNVVTFGSCLLGIGGISGAC